MTLHNFLQGDDTEELWRIYTIPIIGLLVLGYLGVCGISGAALDLHPEPGKEGIPVYTPALRREVQALQNAARQLRAGVQDAQAIEAVWQSGDTSLTTPALLLQEVYGRYDKCEIWTLRLCNALYLSAQATFMAVASPDPKARAQAEVLLYHVRDEALLAEQRLLGHPQATAARLHAQRFRVPFSQQRPLDGGNPLVPTAEPETTTTTGTSQLDITSNRLLRDTGE